jgi:hypothetical protein
MSRFEEKIEEIMQRGGIGFWFVCVIVSAGFYAILWFMMALGVAAGF